jgi:adenosylmethionine-8-amino-7-oxononanoate transaminase
MNPLAKLDHRYVWHPFTQMRDWLKREPIVIVEGNGAVLRDVHGREYLDANSSIWTNLHGHNHPRINRALARQLKKVAHSSALGLANEPASLLAQKLVNSTNSSLRKVFFSDDGSTAMEVALKLAYEYTRRTGRSKQPKFLSLEGAYHGDTVGAVALGHIDLFHKGYSGLLFKTDKVTAPYCYRCPYNRAKPQRADAREYRKCNWECVDNLEKNFVSQKKRDNPYAAFVVEPLIQGAAGMIPQPSGWFKLAAEISRGHGALLIADEVMTGFGRSVGPPKLFACQQEQVQPDFMAVAKGLTGGYLPMAATLTTQRIFDAFLGEYHEFKTFFHGHSFTGNQLGAAAALTNLEILQSPSSIKARYSLQRALQQELKTLWTLPNVGDIRQVGLVVGIELVKDWRTRKSFDLRERAGIRVCEAMAKRGVLTRPIGNIIVLMPPYCTKREQLKQMVSALKEAISELVL